MPISKKHGMVAASTEIVAELRRAYDVIVHDDILIQAVHTRA